ncbi:MAG: DNA polymerase/3'-5' exonuclease PolX [Rhodothermales bacterium]
MTNKRIARSLMEVASLIEITGGNPFRARAFQRAARTIERLETPVVTLLADGTLTQIQGIGEGLAGQIQSLVDYGTFELRDELHAVLPPGLLETLRVKGLGAKKVRRLWKELGVTSLEELEQAARTGRLADLDGFGTRSQESILHHVQLLKQYRQHRHYAEVFPQAASLVATLRTLPGILRAEMTGALRRKMETIATVEVVVATRHPEATSATIAAALPIEADAMETSSDVLLATFADGLPLRIHLTRPDRFGTTWWQRTGSDDHIAAFEAAYGAPGHHADERALFTSAGLPFIEPELREGVGELNAVARGTLPALITEDDLQGTLHNHSTYSDGAHSLQEMASCARRMGLSYFGICDHSQSLRIANGMPVERVVQQQEEIRRLNEVFQHDGGPPFRIFSGIESDILADGSLDYPDDVLASFDFVVASVHTRFNMTETQATERILRAVSNPFTTILGHPTGRLLLAREGYPLDHNAVLAACAEHGVAVELNANPYRLDLDWRWIQEATRLGVLISINPDAHATDQLTYTRWGIAAARKGWLTAKQCLNALSLDAFSAWLAARS